MRTVSLTMLVCVNLLMATSAHAVSAKYRCDDKRVLEVDGTPRILTVHEGTQEWRFRRTGRAPQFVGPAGSHALIEGPSLDLKLPDGRSLWCRKVPLGIAPEDTYVPPRPEK
jgi:hypothetical protein